MNTEINAARKHENKYTGRCFHRSLLSENQIKKIRHEFFKTNANLFRNYKNYVFYEQEKKNDSQQQTAGSQMQKWNFEMENFIHDNSVLDNNRTDKDIRAFYEKFFLNENYE